MYNETCDREDQNDTVKFARNVARVGRQLLLEIVVLHNRHDRSIHNGWLCSTMYPILGCFCCVPILGPSLTRSAHTTRPWRRRFLPWFRSRASAAGGSAAPSRGTVSSLKKVFFSHTITCWTVSKYGFFLLFIFESVKKAVHVFWKRKTFETLSVLNSFFLVERVCTQGLHTGERPCSYSSALRGMLRYTLESFIFCEIECRLDRDPPCL